MSGRKTILVIEDNVPIQNAISLILERNGFDILTAFDGEAGVPLAPKADAVLLDLILPKMDGEGFLKEVRGQGNYVPVVIMSAALSRDEALYKLSSYGIVDFLPKPFTSKALLGQVKKAIELAEELNYVWKAKAELQGFIKRQEETEKRIRPQE